MSANHKVKLFVNIEKNPLSVRMAFILEKFVNGPRTTSTLIMGKDESDVGIHLNEKLRTVTTS